MRQMHSFHRLEVNGGRVLTGETWRLELPPTAVGYADAQLDDYSGQPRRAYPWRRGARMRVSARFSDSAESLLGTAGFGFWNAPFGDPTTRRPALPQAVWFFFGSPPTDLPLAPVGPGQGWFAATLDAGAPAALALTPLAPLAVLAHQFRPLRRRLWPRLQRRLGIRYRALAMDMRDWHTYTLVWGQTTCRFWVDEGLVLATDCSPRGPLGWVCWLDNQMLIATPRGRVRGGVLPTQRTQWLEIGRIELDSAE